MPKFKPIKIRTPSLRKLFVIPKIIKKSLNTVFIPLTFIAGIYGMNFENIPELKSGLGYPQTLLSMSIIALLMFVYFRRKHLM